MFLLGFVSCLMRAMFWQSIPLPPPLLPLPHMVVLETQRYVRYLLPATLWLHCNLQLFEFCLFAYLGSASIRAHQHAPP